MEKISRRYEHSVEDVVGQMLEKRIITSHNDHNNLFKFSPSTTTDNLLSLSLRRCGDFGIIYWLLILVVSTWNIFSLSLHSSYNKKNPFWRWPALNRWKHLLKIEQPFLSSALLLCRLFCWKHLLNMSIKILFVWFL